MKKILEWQYDQKFFMFAIISLPYKRAILLILLIGAILGSFLGYFWHEVEHKKNLNKIVRGLTYLCFTLFALSVICYIISFWSFYLYGKHYLLKSISRTLALQIGAFAYLVYIFRRWKNKKHLNKDPSKEDTIIL
jgi:hypothetical protein